MAAETQTTDFSTGAVRSADRNHLDFAGISPIGLIAIARTMTEGATKYGNANWEKGMPVRDLLNHVLAHIVMYLAGDRSEPHLPHAGWGIIAAIHSSVLWPELNDGELRGPGCTLTPAMHEVLDRMEPELRRRRAAGEFADIGQWSMHDIPEINTLLGQRDAIRATREHIQDQEKSARRDEILGLMRQTLADAEAGVVVLPLDDRQFGGPIEYTEADAYEARPQYEGLKALVANEPLTKAAMLSPAIADVARQLNLVRRFGFVGDPAGQERQLAAQTEAGFRELATGQEQRDAKVEAELGDWPDSDVE